MYEDVTDRAPCFPFYFRQIHAGTARNFTYVVGDPATRTAAIVDPVAELDKIFSIVERDGYCITHALVTHSHADHAGGIPGILERGVKQVVLHESWRGYPRAEACGTALRLLGDETTTRVGELPVQLLHTPGHTPEATCFLVGDASGKQALFTGDTLFVTAGGRCDVSQIPPAQAEAHMFQSLQRIKQLGGDIEVMPGHFYTGFPSRPLALLRDENPALAINDYEVWRKLWFLREYD